MIFKLEEKKLMSNNNNGQHHSNGSYVTQREFSRFIEDQRRHFQELQDSIKGLEKKVDKINEDKIPTIQQKSVKLDTKTKVMWTIVVGVCSFVAAFLTSLI